jgi:hypothetical protein
METINHQTQQFKQALNSLVVRPAKKFWLPRIKSCGAHGQGWYSRYENSDKGAKTLTEQELAILLAVFRNPSNVEQLSSDPEINKAIQTIQGRWLNGMLKELENAHKYKASQRVEKEKAAARKIERSAAKKAKQAANKLRKEEQKAEQLIRNEAARLKKQETARRKRERERKKRAQEKAMIAQLKLNAEQKAILAKLAKI